MKLTPVIMCGGAGSRLWPLSRELHPKPFVELPDGDSLIGKAYSRAAALEGVEDILTVTNRELLFLTLDSYEAVGPEGISSTFLLEPVGRNTAAAIALASLHAKAATGADALLLVMPADHLIRDEAAFAKAVGEASALALQGKIVTFGIQPDTAETGYGYIETAGSEVLRFVEKPDAKTAAAYVAGGRHYWNSGMFLFQASVMIAAFETYCPNILADARSALENGRKGSQGGHSLLEAEREAFERIEDVSIDYAIMEKSNNIACVTVDCGWSDIGSWPAMAELFEADSLGNRLSGEVILEQTENSFVLSEDRLVSLVGVSDLLVIDTADALLIANRDQAQQVKTVFNRLRNAGHEAAKLHRTAHRPWGTYTVLEEGERFKIKRIEVKPGQRLSLQAHRHRSEHWVVVSGRAKVVNGDQEILLSTNESTYIPCGHKHRLENPDSALLVLIEVQSGDYLGEDDIIRFDDIYGRS
jgi:mannose-1-phosphate guanylyltransferase/mannose-6-phosphate isomerase